MIGFRHTPDCKCGCQHVVGLRGDVVERIPDLDVAIVQFDVTCPAGGPQRELTVAYTLAEAES